jgi:prolyl-tRNA editing enzyme YbaK/EbsC (Cys-tRNA(Pro) deacylase)
MSALAEHLEQQGSAFELLPHRPAWTAADEARALGINTTDVLKTLAVRTGIGYVLVVTPARLARLLHIGELAGVRVPTGAEEAARDLVRAREDARADLMRARHRLSKLLLRQG